MYLHVICQMLKKTRAYAVRFYFYPLYKKLETIQGNQAMFFLGWVYSSFSTNSLNASVVFSVKFSLHYQKSLSSSFLSPCHLKFARRTRSYHWCRTVRVF